MIFNPTDPRIDRIIYTALYFCMDIYNKIKLLFGNFISLLCNNYTDAAETSVSTTGDQRVIYMALPGAACLDHIYGNILSISS